VYFTALGFEIAVGDLMSGEYSVGKEAHYPAL